MSEIKPPVKQPVTSKQALQEILKDEKDFKIHMDRKWRYTIFAFAFIVIFAGLGFWLIVMNMNAQTATSIALIQQTSNSQIELNRQSLLSGLYSVNRLVQEEIPTRAERFEKFVVRAKGVILSHNAETDLTDEDMNAMLRENFNLAEQYGMNPWIFIAFAAVESDFNKSVQSSLSSARGIVQFMPLTMKLVLQDDYVPGMEFDPIWACRAWYKYILYLTESVGGDLKWTAAAYMSPQAINFYEQERSIEEFMAWITGITTNLIRYPFLIEERYNKYIN